MTEACGQTPRSSIPDVPVDGSGQRTCLMAFLSNLSLAAGGMISACRFVADDLTEQKRVDAWVTRLVKT